MDKQGELIIGNLIYPLIKDLILPKIQEIIKEKFYPDIIIETVEVNLKEYLEKRYENFLIIDTLIFPNKQTLFKLLYEPLILIAENRKLQVMIDKFPKELFKSYGRILIEDTAGMGKSTLAKYIFLSVVEENIAFPIFIELRKINQNNSFIMEIQKQLSPIGELVPINLIIDVLKKDDFIFILDGFDEISNVDRGFVLNDLDAFIERANNNYFLITSRADTSLSSFGAFKKFYIKPLDTAEAINIIYKYDYYSHNHIAEQLIGVIDSSEGLTIHEFLINPLLVTLLYKTYEYKKNIPLKKTQFYRQVYDAFFEAHDLSKEGYLKRDKFSNLHYDEFERILRYIGYLTSIENKVEYEKDYILNIIQKVIRFNPDLHFKASDFLNDLITTVPLFKIDGINYKWMHKSLQDYFCAKFIYQDAKLKQVEILGKIYLDKNISKFFNVIDLFFELDTNTFENTILRWLLEDLEKHLIYCRKSFPNFPEEMVKLRAGSSFHKKSFIVTYSQEQFSTVDNANDHFNRLRAKYPEVINFNYGVREMESDDISVHIFDESNAKTNFIQFFLHFKYNDLFVLDDYPYDVTEYVLDLPPDTIYVLNNDPHNLLNNFELFEAISLLFDTPFLEVDKCMLKLQQIKHTNDSSFNLDITEW